MVEARGGAVCIYRVNNARSTRRDERGLGDGSVMMDSRRVEALSGVVVMSTAGMANIYPEVCSMGSMVVKVA
jgi:hypothetical protein